MASGFLFKTLGWGGALTVHLCMLGSDIYWKPLLESFMHRHGRFPPQCHLMGGGRKVASTHRPTERQLHVAAAEKKWPVHVARGLPHGRSCAPEVSVTCARQRQTVVGSSFPAGAQRGPAIVLVRSAMLSVTEPQGFACLYLCCGYVHREISPKKQNKTKIQRDLRQKYIAEDDDCEKHRGFSLTTTDKVHCP